MNHRVGSASGDQSDIGLEALQESPEFDGTVEPPDEHEHTNGHYANIYETRDERLAATVPFLRQGLEEDELCICVIDAPGEETSVVEALREGGVDVDAALEDGQLTFKAPTETYLRHQPFDPDAMIALYREILDEALDEYEGLRISAGTYWVDQVDSEAFMEYEGRVNKLFDEHDALALCHYDRTEFSSDFIRDVVQTHPHLIYDDQVCHNFYYVPSDEHLHGDGANEEADQMLQTLRDQSRAKTELANHKRFLQEMNEVTADPNRSFEEKLQALFELGCEQFEVDVGGLNRVYREEGRFVPEYLSAEHSYFEPGKEVPLRETFCRAPAEVMDTATVTDPIAEGYDGIAVYDEHGAEAYLGTHISTEDGQEWTFAFLSTEPRDEPFSEEDRTLLELMAQWVKSALERNQREQELRRSNDQLTALNNLYAAVHDINQELANQSSRQAIEQVVCERLAESDSYEFAWVGTVDETTEEVVPSTSAGARGYLDGITIAVDDSSTAQEPTSRAISTGDTQVVRDISTHLQDERWAERARERDVTASAAVPIAYEDQSYGVLNIYTARDRAFDDEEQQVISQLGEIMGLAIAATEHERDLEQERERLAFINSLLRHNLLNNLNIIDARAGILDPHVDDEGREHLDVVRDSVEEMADLIETLRSLTEGIVEKDHELEPVDLGSVLRQEIDQVASTAENAIFEISADLADAPAVVADDLLGEVFQNLLINAIQHNDKDTPRVAVDVTTADEQVRVDVSDNGPGVPPEIRDNLFEKGEKGPQSEGTGYGLHLVREIIDLYDGDITVENAESTGATLSVTLPRA